MANRLQDLNHDEFMQLVVKHAQASMEMLKLLEQHRTVTTMMKAEAQRRMQAHNAVPTVVKEKLAAIMEKLR